MKGKADGGKDTKLGKEPFKGKGPVTKSGKAFLNTPKQTNNTKVAQVDGIFTSEFNEVFL